jgi:hypothetical protein
MKRIHIFEFEDLPWFSAKLRECMTLYLVAFHRLLRTPRFIAPLLLKAMHATGSREIVDLCSGGGGPWPYVIRRLRDEHGMAATVTLTDLYPNHRAAAAINGARDPAMRYHEQSVDAGNVPPELKGVRTMICSFHHMPPDVARRILSDAQAQRQPLVIFEVSDNGPPVWLWWLAIPVGIVSVLLFTPLAKPFTWRQFFWTYVIPVLPLVIAWDGAVSNARTYTKSDIEELLSGLGEPQGYSWEIGANRLTGYPSTMPYVLGLPR